MESWGTVAAVSESGSACFSDAVSLAKASLVRKPTSEPCPPRFVGSVTPATVNFGSSEKSSRVEASLPLPGSGARCKTIDRFSFVWTTIGRGRGGRGARPGPCLPPDSWLLSLATCKSLREPHRSDNDPASLYATRVCLSDSAVRVTLLHPRAADPECCRPFPGELPTLAYLDSVRARPGQKPPIWRGA